jgi:hypothetical protein
MNWGEYFDMHGEMAKLRKEGKEVWRKNNKLPQQ